MKRNGPKSPKGASKKAVKQLKKTMGKAPTKLHGKAVMREDPKKPGRKIGYATVTKTTLPKYHKPKMKKAAVRKRSTQRKSY